MDDIRRIDRRLLIHELTRPIHFVALFPIIWWLGDSLFEGSRSSLAPFVFLCLVGGLIVYKAQKAAHARRFSSSRFKALWDACRDRWQRFNEAERALRTHQVAAFEELPSTVEKIAWSLYAALRRADVTTTEIAKSEGWLLCGSPQLSAPPPSDPTAQALYRLADRNIAEYRTHYSAVLARVQRAEAQAAVFTTTLDTLRVRMLGHRLSGKSPELDSQDFMHSITEAKLQLGAIDRALEELDAPASSQELGPETEVADRSAVAELPKA